MCDIVLLDAWFGTLSDLWGVQKVLWPSDGSIGGKEDQSCVCIKMQDGTPWNDERNRQTGYLQMQMANAMAQAEKAIEAIAV